MDPLFFQWTKTLAVVLGLGQALLFGKQDFTPTERNLIIPMPIKSPLGNNTFG
jgi:hypothetical protein